MASIYKRNQIYWVSYRQDGKSLCKSLKTTDLTVAKYKKNQLEIKLSEGQKIPTPSKILISDSLNRYLDYLKLKDSQSHHYDQKGKIEQFIKWSKIIYMSQIKPEIVEKYLSHKKSQGLKPTDERQSFFLSALTHNFCCQVPVVAS